MASWKIFSLQEILAVFFGDSPPMAFVTISSSNDLQFGGFLSSTGEGSLGFLNNFFLN